MTVADLKDLLAQYPDHYPVAVQTSSGRTVAVVDLKPGKDHGVNLVRILTEGPN